MYSKTSKWYKPAFDDYPMTADRVASSLFGLLVSNEDAELDDWYSSAFEFYTDLID